jgi:hypothetical protein
MDRSIFDRMDNRISSMSDADWNSMDNQIAFADDVTQTIWHIVNYLALSVDTMSALLLLTDICEQNFEVSL